MTMKNIVALLFCLGFIFSCVSTTEVEDTLALKELLPEQKEAEEEKVVSTEPVFITGRIAEIEEVGGAQKYLYVKFSDTDPSIKNGAKGEIFGDQTFTGKVGNMIIIEKFPGYYYAEILDLIKTIDRNAVVRIQIK